MDIAQQERINLKLVKEVEKYPCLYKTDSVEYCRRMITDKAWAEVGRVVGWPASKCKDKFKNIRAVVSRYKKLMNTGVRKRPYYLMEHMHYTFPYIKAFKEKPSDRQSAHRHDNIYENTYIETVNEENEFQSDVKVETSSKGSHSPYKSSMQQYFDNSPSPLLEAFPESPSSPSPTSPAPSVTKNDSTRRLIQPKDTSQMLSGCNQSEQNTNMDISNIPNDSLNELQNDPKKMFLLSLLPDVYVMNSSQTRKFKRGVLQLVDDILSDA